MDRDELIQAFRAKLRDSIELADKNARNAPNTELANFYDTKGDILEFIEGHCSNAGALEALNIAHGMLNKLQNGS